MAERQSIVVIITDMGTRDPMVAQLKAAVLAINSNVRFVDVTHDIRPRDLLEAAFTLERIFRDFPRRTVFLTLVEAVTGAPKRPILAVSMDYYYFAPDNGVLSYVYENDSVSKVYDVTAEHLIAKPGALSSHRDVYGSAVGWLTKGHDSANFGDQVQDFVRVAIPKVARSGPRELKGMVLQVARVGSVCTNIHENDINAVRQEVGGQVP